MMINDDYQKAMLFKRPEYIPVDIGILPAAWAKYRDDLDAIARRHPIIFRDYKSRNYDEIWSPTYGEGRHVDEWGCVWSNIHQGMESIVTGHPVPSRGDVPPPQGAQRSHAGSQARIHVSAAGRPARI